MVAEAIRAAFYGLMLLCLVWFLRKFASFVVAERDELRKQNRELTEKLNRISGEMQKDIRSLKIDMMTMQAKKTLYGGKPWWSELVSRDFADMKKRLEKLEQERKPSEPNESENEQSDAEPVGTASSRIPSVEEQILMNVEAFMQKKPQKPIIFDDDNEGHK